MILINDTSYPLTNETSLIELFQNFKIDISKGIAIAVNNQVIPRSNWNEYMITHNDKILLIKATQG